MSSSERHEQECVDEVGAPLPGPDHIGPRSFARAMGTETGPVGLVVWSEQKPGECGLPDDLNGGVLALGKFDGVHLGHRSVIAEAVRLARQKGVAAIVGTFDPHPACHFRRDSSPFQLTSLHQRAQLCVETGADAMVVFGFDGRLADVTPECFVADWLKGFGGVVTGADFGFGRGRSGDVSTLAKVGASHGLICRAVSPVAVQSDVVSSSRIRQALRAGDCAMATRLLGRPFTMEATVQDGAKWANLVPSYAFEADAGPYVRPTPGSYLARIETGAGQGYTATAVFPEPDMNDGSSKVLVVPSEGPPGETPRSVRIAVLKRLGP